ncbi:MAG TPA: methionine--tRNA ligase [Longimicrobiales bacterium]|nr:methionine--tRNA ligase [Longimicrobiales bacterium]
MSEPGRFYITTAIDYANGAPHMGHAIEKIGADAMARYRRLRGDDVHFLMGMDEHGLKVLQSADAAGTSPQAWVDDIAAQFMHAWERLGISHDDFIRTTQARHRPAVEEMIRRISESGDLYVGRYEGYYCVGCEAFKRDDELVKEEGAAPRCPIHPTREVTWTEEENWFFRLSAYQDRLLKLLEQRPDFIQPDARLNEIRKVIEGGLEDISVSRSRLPWGIPWPGDEDHTVYVWLDALTNYLSAIGFPDERYHERWPAAFHVIGKDITRFHCIYWPAFLMSAGIELPGAVWAHGFVTTGGGKMSKSEGVRVDLAEAIDRHGPDALRYFLLREIPWNGDGEFSYERFDERYTSELADNFGNLASRSIAMIERYRDGVVPAGGRTSLDEDVAGAIVRYRAAMDAQLLHHGLAAALALSSAANQFVDARAPWAQSKDPALAEELDITLSALARCVGALATLLQPFMPARMAEVATRLGLDGVVPLDEVVTLDMSGHRVHRGEILFPKVR